MTFRPPGLLRRIADRGLKGCVEITKHPCVDAGKSEDSLEVASAKDHNMQENWPKEELITLWNSSYLRVCEPEAHPVQPRRSGHRNALGRPATM